MSEKTYLKLRLALSAAKFEARRDWLMAWQSWPGALPLSDVASHWAQELQDLNDAHMELESIYQAALAKARGEG